METTLTNHIRPFLWYANENAEVVCQTLDTLRASGIMEVVLENRGGDWWGTERWWTMLDKTLEHCEKTGMRLWLLDDSHVSTGSANDSLKKPENACFRPKNIKLDGMDIAAPFFGGAIRLPLLEGDEKLLQVLAYPVDATTGEVLPKPIDLTDKIVDELCIAELPEGRWRIFFVIQAASDHSGFFSYYITMLNRASCRHLIDEIHEKVYEHCGKHFGKAFAGFFSDEPAFGNCNGEYDYENKINRVGEFFRRVLAWDDALPAELAKELSMSEAQVKSLIPAFMAEIKDTSMRFRLAYMNVITRLWKENFSEQLGEWCHAHGVEYIGHVLEDGGAHMHFGFGCGHFFRSMCGQDMAGWDIVLGQMIPFGTNLDHLESRIFIKENFYQYTLPKLAASLGHHYPHMKNRVICEVMGGYGWAAGVSFMKYLFSFCIANGTNHFVPHAFSMFPPKCFNGASRTQVDLSSLPPGFCLTYLPPTFYACGFNPQSPAIERMFNYIQRVSRLLNGTHRPDVALFYAVEADWMHGEAQNMDDVAAVLTRGGLDFDFLDADMLHDSALSVNDGTITLHGESYRAVVVPYSAQIPASLMQRFGELANKGARIIFVNALPSEIVKDCEMAATENNRLETVPFDGLAAALASCKHVCIEKAAPELRFYHLEKGDGKGIVIFFNEGKNTVDTFVSLKEFGSDLAVYDPWDDERFAAQRRQDGALRLRIAPLQLLVVEYGNGIDAATLRPFLYDDFAMKALPLKYDIYKKEITEDEFSPLLSQSAPINLLVAKNLTRSCAEFKYVTEFDCDDPSKISVIRIPKCGECVKMTLNGEEFPWECGPVAQFDVRGKLLKGTNRIEFLTADSPAYADRFEGSGKLEGVRLPLSPHGFIGDIEINA